MLSIIKNITPIKIFIRKCMAKDLFTRVNGVYKYGTTTIGLTEDQTVQWVKDNADIHALLKNELRGPKPRTKQTVELKEAK